jgi:hypothetical protein
MAKPKGPTAEDRATVVRVALAGIAGGLDLGEIAARLAPLHPKNSTFPGEDLLELAADAIEESGASRERPLEFEAIRKRHLPEDRAHTRAQHHKAEYALRAAAMVRAGVDPGLLDEVSWWSTDDLWFWALSSKDMLLRPGVRWSSFTKRVRRCRRQWPRGTTKTDPAATVVISLPSSVTTTSMSMLPSTTCRRTSRREVASGKMRALADGARVLREEVGAGSVATSRTGFGHGPRCPSSVVDVMRLQMV